MQFDTERMKGTAYDLADSRRIHIVPLLMLAVIFVGPNFYWYVSLLRVAVTAWALYLIWIEVGSGFQRSGWLLALIFIALLFNPITPIHLPRIVWAVFDVGVALFFQAYWRALPVNPDFGIERASVGDKENHELGGSGYEPTQHQKGT